MALQSLLNAAGVGSRCTERSGGVSLPPFDSFNLGDHVGDDPQAVVANRRRLHASLGARPVFLRQVHGVGVVRLAPTTPDDTEADACWTDAPDLACTVMAADCLPVLLCEASGAAVAAAHAGWRSLSGATSPGAEGPGVLEALWADIGLHRPDLSDPTRWRVWLGPCIGADAFEVGDEVRAAFVRHDDAAAAAFRRGQAPSKWWADLAGLARQRLERLGFPQVAGNDGSAPWCTVSQPGRWFSHRRDSARSGGTGRMAACVWRDA